MIPDQILPIHWVLDESNLDESILDDSSTAGAERGSEKHKS